MNFCILIVSIVAVILALHNRITKKHGCVLSLVLGLGMIGLGMGTVCALTFPLPGVLLLLAGFIEIEYYSGR